MVRSDIELILKSSRKEAVVYVEDQLEEKPAANTDLLFSDGTSIIGTGKTGDDGVFRGKFPELTTINDLRVLATNPKGSATNLLNISNLQFSTGLSRRGYIYTDKSAYQQGEAVSVRGVIRDVEDGSYIIPEDRDYTVRVTDPAGRLIGETELQLSDFGAFDTALQLPESAAFGDYSIISHPTAKEDVVYQGNFTVQKFKLDRIRLAFDFPQQVYFRGEKIETTLSAAYYWGSPAADKLVEISLPDGRKLSQKTDADGKIQISLETAGFIPGTELPFSASIPSLNISANNAVFLARLGYQIQLKPDQPLALANEAFEVQVETIGADGEPVGKDLTITVLRSEVQKQDPVLEAVPWIAYNPKSAAQVTVEEIEVTTDAETGQGTAILNLEKGGIYTLRANGQDRFEQTVTGETSVTVSDDEDLQKLRFFAEKSTYEVGATIPLRLHSRVAKGLALLTYEGEEVLGHEIISIEEGDNELEIPVEHAHFPNFRVSVALIDGRELRGASKRFNIKRELNVVITPSKDVYAPGEEAEVNIVVTDQLGEPVEAELALALVNQALLDRYPNNRPQILTFFQEGATRYTEFRLVSTCDWVYTAFSKQTQTGADDAVIVANDAEQFLAINQLELNLNPTNSVLSFSCMSAHESIFNNGRAQALSLPQHGQQQLMQQEAGGFVYFNGTANLNIAGQIDDVALQTLNYVQVPVLGNAFRSDARNGLAVANSVSNSASIWLSPIATGKDGKATAKFTAPDSAGQWNLAAKGVTTDTLVGQAETEIITRKDFLVELRTPDVLQEGDTMEFLATVHNLTDFEGEATVTLKITGAEQPFNTEKTIEVKKQSTTEVVLDGHTIPFIESLKLEVAAVAGPNRDEAESNLSVRPWGLEYADQGGGVTNTEAGVELTLPKGQNYTGRKLHIALSPSIEQAIIDLALERGSPLFGVRSCWCPPTPQTPGSSLLAAVSALEYARARGASDDEIFQLTKRVRSLVASAVVTQLENGSWSWNRLSGHSTRSSTASIYWGLALANKAGIPVHHAAFQQAENYFAGEFPKIDTNDADSKAIIIHALSLTGRADFSAANRLYRDRQSLSETALAYMAAAFIRMERPTFAEDLLRILDNKLEGKTSWKANSRHAVLNDDTTTTALALWSYAKLRRDSPTTANVANHLLGQTARLRSESALGATVAALTEYYNRGERPGDDYVINLVINDEPFMKINSTDLASTQTFAVPADQIEAGTNVVRVEIDGRGEVRFAATLFGFSPDLKDPGSFDRPEINSRNYYHDKLSYRDVPLKSLSTSPVAAVEVGQRFRASTRFTNTHPNHQQDYLVLEEQLPAGALLVDGSLRGNFKRSEVDGSTLRLYFAPGNIGDVNYELVAHAPGDYKILPGILRDTFDNGRMRIGKSATLKILPPGDESDDPYKMNGAEHFELATKLFNDGKLDEAQTHLDALFANKDDRKRYERDIARMLLWIHTGREELEPARIVQMFEILRERHPELVIPFDKTLIVGRAYREISEYERAWLVFQAAIESSFLNDAKLSAVLEDQGQYLGSVRYQEELWQQYPDSADVTTAFFALSQSLFQKAPEAKAIAAREKRIRERQPTPEEADAEIHENPADREEPEKIAMLEHCQQLLKRFLTLYPESPLADEAAFSEANVFFALKDYEKVVEHAARGAERHADSELKTSFEYMAALGHFWQRHYEEALASATRVAEGESKDRDYARYITAQIYHATGKPADAMEWYEKVRELYPDAADAIDYFQEKKISMGEVTTLQPGEDAEIEIDYRNIKEAVLEIYRVDLMKLYLREKNLSNITAVDLAGIDPESSLNIELGDGLDFADKTKEAELPIEEEGAYLVICRGDNLYTSGLILITPLKLEIQETPNEGSVRVNVRDLTDDGNYIPEVL
ncbi:MAG: MG2 domain-containing protein, partial [Verrucomicrobiota bacterium]